MQLLELPLELLRQIFLKSIHARSFKRAMRLRTVSRKFRQLTDEAIFSSSLITDIIVAQRSSHETYGAPPVEWMSFVHTYLAHRVCHARNRTWAGEKIHLTAQRLCDMSGDSGDDAIFACVRELCALTYESARRFNGVRLIDDLVLQAPQHSVWTENELQTFLFDGAVYTGRTSVVQKLISEPPAVKWRPSDAMYDWPVLLEKPLELAAQRGNMEMLQLLLAAEPTVGDGVPIPVSLSTMILCQAARGNHADIFDYVLGRSEAYSLSQNSQTAAPRTSSYRALQVALELAPSTHNYRQAAARFRPGSEIFSARQHGDLLPRIDTSAQHGRLDVVRYFLQQGVDVNNPNAWRGIARTAARRRNRSDFKPLLRAVGSGNEEIVRLMLEHGADPNWYHPHPTALMIAVHRGRLPIIRLLVEYGADINEGLPPPIVVAVRSENMDAFRFLREVGATLDTPETGGWAMAMAKMYGSDSLVEVLVEEGVDRELSFHRAATREEMRRNPYLIEDDI